MKIEFHMKIQKNLQPQVPINKAINWRELSVTSAPTMLSSLKLALV